MSTLKVTNIESPSGGGVNAKITDINGGQLSNRNLIINGAMLVAQRGTSSTNSGYATVDRFRPSYVGGQITQTQEDMTTSDSPYSLGFRKFYRLQNTTATADPPAAGNHRRFLIRLEAQNIANSGWDYTSSSSYITLSMWVRSSVGQTFTWFAQTIDGTQQSYAWDVTLTANTWTKITKSFPGNSNITIDNDTDLGLMFDCGMFWGTQYTDSSKTNDAWSAYSGTARTKDFDDTWATTTDATFDVTGVQLEVGDVATAFEHRSFGDELTRCERYYQESSPRYVAAQYLITNEIAGQFVPFKPEMRATPSPTYASLSYRENTGSFTNSTLSSNATLNKNGINFVMNASGAATSDSFVIFMNDGVFDAEL
jgi:hypothetical protein